jgi:UDP-3-O-[3-hydroxymyristoyl] glucosamine N-acyltransferase
VFDSVILFAGTEFCVKMCRHNVVLSNCSVGEFCIIHNGACVGQDGEQLSM